MPARSVLTREFRYKRQEGSGDIHTRLERQLIRASTFTCTPRQFVQAKSMCSAQRWSFRPENGYFGHFCATRALSLSCESDTAPVTLK